MLSRFRWSCVVVAAVSWVVWIVVAWCAYQYAEMPAGLRLANDLTRTLAVVGALLLVLAFLVAPVLMVARTWQQIGEERQMRRCQCHKADNVVPIRPGRINWN